MSIFLGIFKIVWWLVFHLTWLTFVFAPSIVISIGIFQFVTRVLEKKFDEYNYPKIYSFNSFIAWVLIIISFMSPIYEFVESWDVSTKETSFELQLAQFKDSKGFYVTRRRGEDTLSYYYKSKSGDGYIDYKVETTATVKMFLTSEKPKVIIYDKKYVPPTKWYHGILKFMSPNMYKSLLDGEPANSDRRYEFYLPDGSIEDIYDVDLE